METLLEVGDYCHPRPCSPEGETVCAALSRYENTLRDAIREIHVDVSAFKIGMERRLEETSQLSAPLGRAVSQLQEENQQLKNQLEVLTRQVEQLLMGNRMGEQSIIAQNGKINHHGSPKLNGIHEESHEEVKGIFYGKGQAQIYQTSPSVSPPAVGSRVSSMMTGPLSSSSPSTTRFSSRATFALSNKNSTEREDSIEVDSAPTSSNLNGHAHTTDSSALVNGKLSPPSDLPLLTAPPAVRVPHLPITATTKTAELRAASPISPGGARSPASDSSPLSQSPNSSQHSPASSESPAPLVKTWTPAPVRTLASPRLQEKTNSAPAKSVTYSGLPQLERDSEVGGDRPGAERRRELVRSQTLPRNIGAQARRSIFEKLEAEANSRSPKPVDSKPTLKRSQSFGVSSASSIKQVLLEWCRSKTIGYQNIEIQNFSSSWSDGLAFCALVHSFFPMEFDYTELSPNNRKHNFELAFGTAETKAGCDRLIEVDDMMIMGRKPDPMCVFTYVQSLYNHLRKFE